MYLIAGLGNPEAKYAATRQNVGVEAAECLKGELNCGMTKIKFHAEIAQGKLGDEQVLVARPLTYMNNSGQAIREIANFYKITPDHIIVMCDDVSIPFGHLRLRANGSAGGHNGLKSIIAQLGSQDFARVKIGVGEKPQGWDLADYVLCRMSSEEQKEMAETVARAAKAALCIIKNGMGVAMNRYNTPKAKPVKEKKEEATGKDN
ncbi:MAG: aminoacyl-tRNA hydrolase [Firmicutes bacterium]|nr:aminoacyl-tRNA hydrolase [Bacillota bacterium]